MDWGTLIAEVLKRGGGGRTSTADEDLTKLAAIDAIARHDSRNFHFNEERFTIQTVASQNTYTTADGLPQGIVRFISPILFVDRDQDASNRYPIKRVTPSLLDQLRSGVEYTSEPEQWSYFAETLEVYPDPDAVHDVHGKVVTKPGVPIKRLESGAWKYYKPWTTSFVPTNEMDDPYPDAGSGESNAWFTDPVAFAVISNYTSYLMWSGAWHATEGQDQKALQRYTEMLSELEDRATKLRAPRSVEPMDLGESERF